MNINENKNRGKVWKSYLSFTPERSQTVRNGQIEARNYLPTFFYRIW